MSTFNSLYLNNLPSGLLSQPYIEAQYANPHLPVYLKCMLYSQIRINVDPRLIEDKHWITQVKALIKDHYLNWHQHHSDHLALNGYILFISNGRSVRFLVLPRLDTAEAGAGTDKPRIDTEGPRFITTAINDGVPANPEFRRSGSRSCDQIC